MRVHEHRVPIEANLACLLGVHSGSMSLPGHKVSAAPNNQLRPKPPGSLTLAVTRGGGDSLPALVVVVVVVAVAVAVGVAGGCGGVGPLLVVIVVVVVPLLVVVVAAAATASDKVDRSTNHIACRCRGVVW